MIDEQTRKLAERIALFLQQESEPAPAADSFSIVRASLEKINERLDKIESRLSAAQNPKSEISNPKSFHASQEKFEALPELASQTINSANGTGDCPFEPTGKPCDHCSMCNSRGF